MRGWPVARSARNSSASSAAKVGCRGFAAAESPRLMRGMSRASQLRRVQKEPFRAGLDPLHFVKIRDVLMIPQRFVPEAVEVSALSRDLDAETG
jgi:hypothetical protein